MGPLVIALDVDSTVMTHGFPGLGEDIGAIPWLKKALEMNPDRVRFILHTMRSGESAEIAKAWLEERGVPITAINTWPGQETWTWTTSPKAFAHIYVDDRCAGVPKRSDGCIDWGRFGMSLLTEVATRLGPLDPVSGRTPVRGPIGRPRAPRSQLELPD